MELLSSVSVFIGVEQEHKVMLNAAATSAA
jgi:hypothetical protein